MVLNTYLRNINSCKYTSECNIKKDRVKIIIIVSD